MGKEQQSKMEKSFCDLIKKIQENPLNKVEGMTVRSFYELQKHLEECSDCNAIVDDINEKYKDVPSDPNSGWGKTNYN